MVGHGVRRCKRIGQSLGNDQVAKPQRGKSTLLNVLT
jgi:hypothetical protein